MENKKEIEPVVEEQTPEEKDLISSDDVLAVVSGNQIALIEQLERAKQVALEQLEAGRDSGPINQKQLEAELKRREADLEAAKRVQAEMKRKEEEARQEAERKKREAEEAARQQKLAAEAELRRQAEEARQRQLQLEEEERKKREEQERLEQEKIAREQEIARKKQEKEAAILQAKLEKEQKRLARLEEIKQKKLAKEEEKRKRKEAREEARQQRQLAKEEAKKQSQKEKVESLEATTSGPNSSSQPVGGVASSTGISSISQPQSLKSKSASDVKKVDTSKENIPHKKFFQKQVVVPQSAVAKKSKVEGVKKMEEEKLKKDAGPVVVPPVDSRQNAGVQPVGIAPNAVSKPESLSQTPVAPIPVNHTPAVIPDGSQATPNMTVVAPNTSATSVNAVPISNSGDNKTTTAPTASVAISNSKVETLEANANSKTAVTTNNTNTQGVDSNERKEGAPEGKKNNFKYWMTLILFICLLLLVVFLPQISEMVSRYKEEKQRAQDAIITTGDLKCKLTKSDDKYDYEYKATFAFRDSKMHRLNYTAITKGDRNEDALELTEMKKTCDILKEQTGTMEGIDVVCTLVNGVYTNEQILKYDVLDTTKVTTAYLEAGGTYPNYTYQQDISEIEKQMKASGYTCERER